MDAIREQAEAAAQRATDEVSAFADQATEQITEAAETIQTEVVAAAQDLGILDYEEPNVDTEQIIQAAKEAAPFESIKGLDSAVNFETTLEAFPAEEAAELAGGVVNNLVFSLEVPFSLFALLIEIFRDFWQIISLCFSFVFITPPTLDVVFPKISFAINVDFAMIVPNLPSAKSIFVGVWWIMWFVSIIAMGGLRYIVNKVQPKPRREFIMLRTWAMLDKKTTRIVQITVFMLTLLYQPVSQNALELVLCSYRVYNTFDQSCAPGIYIFTAVVALIVITVMLPIMLGQMILHNSPKIREYDAEGRPAEYTPDMYQVDVSRVSRTSPLASLFNPYKRPHRLYKVVVMVFKLYLVVVAIAFSSNNVVTHLRPDPSDNNVTVTVVGNTTTIVDERKIVPETDDSYDHVRPILIMLGMVAYVVATIISKPFFSTLANVLETVLRIFAFLSVLCAYLIIHTGATGAFEAIMIVLMSIALVVSIGFLVFGAGPVQEKLRVWRSDIRFTWHNDEKEDMPKWFGPLDSIDWGKERKHRVWHQYWDDVLMNHPHFRHPDGKISFEYADSQDTTAYLLLFQNSVAERHHENKEIVVDIGREKYFEGLQAVPEHEAQAIIYATRILHGRDCFYGAPENGAFGVLYIIPFPFEAFFITDGTNQETQLGASDLPNIIAFNNNEEVRRRRHIREKLRGLNYMSDRGHSTYFLFQEHQTIKIPDGHDAQGHQKYKSVQVLVTFTHGTFGIATDYDTPIWSFDTDGGEERTMKICPGFQCSLTYPSGTYTEHGGGTVGSRTIGHAEMGITNTFADDPRLNTLFDGNSDVVENGRQHVLWLKDEFKRHYMKEFYAKQQTLSYGFWARVYDDDFIKTNEAARFFREYEANPAIKELATKKYNIWQMGQARLKFFDACPATKIWVCFWQDLWVHNVDMSIIAECDEAKELLNPAQPGSISWTVQGEEQVNERLRSAGLQSENGKGFISASWIKQLFQKMHDSMTSFDGEAVTRVVDLTDDSNFKNMNELGRHPLYGGCLISLYDVNIGHPNLEWIMRMAPGAAQNDFYPQSVDEKRDDHEAVGVQPTPSGPAV